MTRRKLFALLAGLPFVGKLLGAVKPKMVEVMDCTGWSTYVAGRTGCDVTGTGALNRPFATIARAMERPRPGGWIVVLGDPGEVRPRVDK